LRDTINSRHNRHEHSSNDQPPLREESQLSERRTSNPTNPLLGWLACQPQPQRSTNVHTKHTEQGSLHTDSNHRFPRNTMRSETHSSTSSSGSAKTQPKKAIDEASDTSVLSAFSGPPTRRSSASSNKSVRFEEVSTLQHAGKSSPRSSLSAFEILIQDLNLDRIFFDPELDILNRLCLEYIELSKLTLSKSWISIRSQTHFSRVYQYMKETNTDQGKQAVTSPPPTSKPVVHNELFLDHLRAPSSRIFDPKMPLPHLSHGHRLNEQRFQKIVEGIFTRRHFLGCSVGVSAEKLSDLS